MKRKRSTFRRGGTPYGIDGRNKAAISRGRSQNRKPYGHAEREQETVDFRIAQFERHHWDAVSNTLGDALNNLAAGLVQASINMTEAIEIVSTEIGTYVPQPVDVVIVGMDDLPANVRAELLAAAPGTPVLLRSPPWREE